MLYVKVHYIQLTPVYCSTPQPCTSPSCCTAYALTNWFANGWTSSGTSQMIVSKHVQHIGGKKERCLKRRSLLCNLVIDTERRLQNNLCSPVSSLVTGLKNVIVHGIYKFCFSYAHVCLNGVCWCCRIVFTLLWKWTYICSMWKKNGLPFHGSQ